MSEITYISEELVMEGNLDSAGSSVVVAGRYATMKLAQLTGETDTKNFVNDCIKTTLNN